MIRRLLLAGGIACSLAVGPAPIFAQAFADEAVPALIDGAQSRSIDVPRDKSIAFRLDRPVGELVVAQPNIAEIVAKTDRSFYVRGKADGVTNILVYDPQRVLTEVIDVRVGPDVRALQDDLNATYPGESIRVNHLADGLHLTGEVSTSTVAAGALAVAQRYTPKAISSALTVRETEQVILEVRVIEASRSALQDFGIDLTAVGSGFTFASGSGLLGASAPMLTSRVAGTLGNTDIGSTLRVLEDQGVIRTLARPNLTAVSGQEAQFLAGGEFPFPIPAGPDQVAIDFRSFGVTLKFKPEIQQNGLIRIKVEPEVSQLDPRNSLRINGFDVPSLTVRRASTTVELHDGKSFAIAGMFQDSYSRSLRQVPGIGDIPILGSLFKSQRWQRNETELLIVVTPRLSNSAKSLPDPIPGAPHPNGIDLILQRLQAQGELPDLRLSGNLEVESDQNPVK